MGGGTHDAYVPPKKQLYRYLFIREWVVVSHERSTRGRNDSSYIYQLSLVVATATVFFLALYGPTTRYEEAFLLEGEKRPRSLRSLGLASLLYPSWGTTPPNFEGCGRAVCIFSRQAGIRGDRR